MIGKCGGGRLSVGPRSLDCANYLYWLHYANVLMMGAGFLTFRLAALKIEPENEAVRDLDTRYQRGFKVAEQRLGSASYLAGEEFTAADIIMLFPLTTIHPPRPLRLRDYPRLPAAGRRAAGFPARDGENRAGSGAAAGLRIVWTRRLALRNFRMSARESE